jgi:hypothetical protein
MVRKAEGQKENQFGLEDLPVPPLCSLKSSSQTFVNTGIICLAFTDF